MNGADTREGNPGASDDEEDPLDSPYFDAKSYVDGLFPDIESLALLPRIDSKLQRYEIELHRSIQELQAAATSRQKEAAERVRNVKHEISSVFDEVAALQAEAGNLDMKLSGMTDNIRVLDRTKRNITATMTLIKRLQMLMTAFKQLERLAVSKKYAETASLLSAVMQLMLHFRGYRSIPQIAKISQQIADMQRTFLEQVSADFDVHFSNGISATSVKILSDACSLVEVLGEGPRERIISWYINSQLREYRSIFRGNEEAASLDNISRRYAWLKRIFKAFSDEHVGIFPEHWHVFDQLVKSSCETTREDLAQVLSKSRPDVKILLQALQETMDFERYASERLSGVTKTPRVSVESVRSVESAGSVVEKRSKGIRISEVFEPYLGLFVELQDRTLSSMLASYKTQPWPGLEEQVLPSSADLFYFYLTTITQCAQLSTGEPLWAFARVMAKYLNQYTEQILAAKYTTPSVRIEEIIMILKTADYCSATTQQLEERMKSVIQPQYVDRVTYEFQNNAFLALMNRSLALLVSHLEKAIDIALKEMIKLDWHDLTEVGDQSQYISMLVAGLLREGKRVLQNLGKEKFIRTFCDRVVENLANQYITAIARCRPINETGAEQMLLDVDAIRVALTNLPGNDAPPNYPKLVAKHLSRIETILKLLLTSADPPEGLVQNYLFLIQDRNTGNFVKVLDMKGIPKTQQNSYLNLFISSIANHREELQDRNGLLGDLALGDSKFSEQSRIDPSSFFRDSLGLGSAPTGHPPERFGAQFGKLFSKRSISGRSASGTATPST